MVEVQEGQFGSDQFKQFLTKVNKDVEKGMPVIEEAVKDKKRLDFINSMGNGWWWVADNNKGNSFFIRNTSSIGQFGFKDVRQAIDYAMKERGIV